MGYTGLPTPSTVTMPVQTMVLPGPATPASSVTISHELLNKMANHHLTVNYIVIGILVLVLAGAGMGAWLGLRGYDRLMERASASEKLMVQYEQSWKQANDQYQKEAQEHASDRATFASQIAAANAKEAGLVQALQAKNAQADQSISAVLSPGKSAQDAFLDLKDAYKATAVSLGLSVSTDPQTREQLLTFPTTTVQQFTATKLDRDRLADNVQNLGQQLAEKDTAIDGLNKTNASLGTDYTALQASDAKLVTANAQCQDTVKVYKKVAVRTKWQKVWAGAKKGGMVVAGLLAGYELGKNL